MEKQVTIKAYAKINLGLNIIGKQNGYHELSTIMQGIALYDTITASLIKKGTVKVKFKGKKPKNERCTELARRLCEKREFGVSIIIEKKIPIASGLGGSSADFAGIILAISELFDIPLEDLYPFADAYGSDTFFLLSPYTALCQGRGNLVDYLSPLPVYHVVIALHKGCNTKNVFDIFDSMEEGERADLPTVYGTLKNGEKAISYNMLLDSAAVLAPKIKSTLDLMQDEKSALTLLTGSGGGVFSLYKDKNDAESMAEILKNKGIPFILTETLNNEKMS